MPDSSIRHRLQGVMAPVAASAVITAFAEPISAHRWAASITCLIAAGWGLHLVYRAHTAPRVTVGVAFFALLLVFHVGLVASFALWAQPRLINAADARWVNDDAFVVATVIVTVAMLSFAATYRFSSSTAAPAASIFPALPDRPTTDGPGLVGAVLVGLGLMMWLLAVVTSGAAVLGSSYVAFLQATQGATSLIAIAYLLIGFGLATVGATDHAPSRKFALILFVPWAVLAFALGLRGEVIIPLAAYVVTRQRRRPRAVNVRVLLAVTGLLAGGAAVRVARQSGIGTAALDPSTFNPLDGVAELGYSIRPLVHMVQIHDGLGLPFVGVATYLAPFRRFFEGRVLGLPYPDVAEDPAAFGGFVAQSFGQIGGSPIAEAYRVGGMVAVIIVLGTLGFLIAKLDVMVTLRSGDALIGMIAFSLLLWVRNDFTPVPAQLLLAVVIAAGIRAVDSLRGAKAESSS